MYALLALQALITLQTLLALQALLALQTLLALYALIALQTLLALYALLAIITTDLERIGCNFVSLCLSNCGSIRIRINRSPQRREVSSAS